MAKKFDPAIIEAEENLLIDYQFLLQELMKQKSVTPTQLAEMAGLSKSRISQIISPDANPTVKTFARLFHVLGERVVPELDAASQESSPNIIGTASAEWAPFEQAERLDRVVRRNDAELIALVKETAEFASNDNYAKVVVMKAEVMITLEAKAA